MVVSIGIRSPSFGDSSMSSTQSAGLRLMPTMVAAWGANTGVSVAMRSFMSIAAGGAINVANARRRHSDR